MERKKQHRKVESENYQKKDKKINNEKDKKRERRRQERREKQHERKKIPSEGRVRREGKATRKWKIKERGEQRREITLACAASPCRYYELGKEEKESRVHNSNKTIKHRGARPLHEFTENEVPGSQSTASL